LQNIVIIPGRFVSAATVDALDAARFLRCTGKGADSCRANRFHPLLAMRGALRIFARASLAAAG
jgi:hypothetical protein